jgi:hypothetical protein
MTSKRFFIEKRFNGTGAADVSTSWVSSTSNGKKLLFAVDNSEITNVSTVWVFHPRFDGLGTPKRFDGMGRCQKVSSSWVSETLRRPGFRPRRNDFPENVSTPRVPVKTQTVETFFGRVGGFGFCCGTHTVETFPKRFDGIGT